MLKNDHCVKRVHIRSFSGPYFSTLGLNIERYSVSLRIHSECGKIRTRKTLNTMEGEGRFYFSKMKIPDRGKDKEEKGLVLGLGDEVLARLEFYPVFI